MAVCVRFHIVKRHSTKLNKRTTNNSSSLHRPEGGVNSIWRRERVREAMVQKCCNSLVSVSKSRGGKEAASPLVHGVIEEVDLCGGRRSGLAVLEADIDDHGDKQNGVDEINVQQDKSHGAHLGRTQVAAQEREYHGTHRTLRGRRRRPGRCCLALLTTLPQHLTFSTSTNLEMVSLLGLIHYLAQEMDVLRLKCGEEQASRG
ncbi:hypothetical protein E2C01_026096 [Portunus trituberculatus]|uniref:Uncharacterized protein n=1 Tax=Portunus trituberculatus TaxID=210409 RepID=A0A5B7EH70_PORTR|nr:hypothetical protein [Portunus trituberculatus]